MGNPRLLSIFLIVFIDLLGFGLILPLLPFYADSYGASPTVVGLLTASYAAAQLLGAPVLGRLSDQFGRRPILLVSIFGTSLGFLLLGYAEPLGIHVAQAARPAVSGSEYLSFRNVMILGIMFASRILDGATGGNISVAQAYITDITDEDNRARGLGVIGAAFGLGFIFGPVIGGTLSDWGFALPALFAAGLAAINLLGVYFFLPESLTPERRLAISDRPRVGFSIETLFEALRRPRVGPLLQVRFFYGLAFSTFQSIFPLFAQYGLGLTPRSTGYLLTYVGILVVVVQGVAVGWLSRRFRDRDLIFAGVTVMTLTLLGWAFTESVLLILVVLAPLALAAGTLNTVLNSALTKAVDPEEVGGTLGLASALESSTRVFAPTMGGYLLGQIAVWAPGVFSALVMTWVTGYVWWRIISPSGEPLERVARRADS